MGPYVYVMWRNERNSAIEMPPLLIRRNSVTWQSNRPRGRRWRASAQTWADLSGCAWYAGRPLKMTIWKFSFQKKKKKKDARTVEFYHFWLSGNIKGWWIYLLLNLNTQDELMTWQGFVAGQICHGSGNNYKTASSPEIKKAGSGYTE